MINQVKTKKCHTCCAILPLTEFNLYRRSEDGHLSVCRNCKHQDGSLRWTIKYGRRHRKYAPGIIRNMRSQNRAMVNKLLSMEIRECSAFIPHEDGLYRTEYDPSNTYGIPVIRILKDGNPVKGIYVNDNVETILDTLKSFGIRLELSDKDVAESINQIYYMGNKDQFTK